MTIKRNQATPRLAALATALGAAALLSACVVEAPPRYVQVPPPRPAPTYEQPAPVYEPAYEPAYVPEDTQEDEPVVSVYVDPPIDQPEPIAVQWAPPPMLVEVPPPQPYPDAVWTGGYWAWEGRWFWAAGRWAPPPRPRYVWVQPYYEHRADVVVFVPGFWCPPERHFVPPPPGLRISLAIAAPGVRRGRPPMGPQGVFVPPPPGSRAGIIVPAPVGTPPAVVVSAPPVVNVGMRVHGNVDINSRNTTSNVSNVTIEAPSGATATGQAFHNSVPARAPLAASLAPAGRPAAPRPMSQQAIPAYQSGRPPMPLPAGQPPRRERNDRFNGQEGGRYGTPPQQAPAPQGQGQQPAWQRGQQPAWQQGQQPAPQQGQQRPGYGQPLPAQGQGQAQPPQPGQGRPEFDQPPRTPAPISGQPQAPQGQGQQPAWQRGQQPGWQPGQQRPGQGQPQQGQVPGQPQPLAPRPGQPPQPSAQDPRRGGSPQGQAPAGPAGAQPAVPGQQPPQARGKEAEQATGTKQDERKKPPREHPDDRDKRNGERDR